MGVWDDPEYFGRAARPGKNARWDADGKNKDKNPEMPLTYTYTGYNIQT